MAITFVLLILWSGRLNAAGPARRVRAGPRQRSVLLPEDVVSGVRLLELVTGRPGVAGRGFGGDTADGRDPLDERGPREPVAVRACGRGRGLDQEPRDGGRVDGDRVFDAAADDLAAVLRLP